MTRVQHVRSTIHAFLTTHGVLPAQINAHPDFVVGLIEEVGITGGLVMRDMKIDGIPVFLDKSTRSCFPVSKENLEY